MSSVPVSGSVGTFRTPCYLIVGKVPYRRRLSVRVLIGEASVVGGHVGHKNDDRVGPDPPTGPRREAPVRWGAALAVLAACVQLLDSGIRASRHPALRSLREFLSHHPHVALQATVTFAVACFCFLVRHRLVWPLRRAYARLRLSHFEMRRARQEYRRYPELITVHMKWLEVTQEALAAKLGLPVPWVILMCGSPDLVPRPEIMERLCRELLVPVAWVRGETDDYGAEYNTERLRRYHEIGQAELWTSSVIMTATAETRADAVSAIEFRLLKETPREGGMSV